MYEIPKGSIWLWAAKRFSMFMRSLLRAHWDRKAHLIFHKAELVAQVTWINHMQTGVWPASQASHLHLLLSTCVECRRSTARDDAAVHAGDPLHKCGSMVCLLCWTGARICLNLELCATGTSCLATEEEEPRKVFQVTPTQLANYLVNAG